MGRIRQRAVRLGPFLIAVAMLFVAVASGSTRLVHQTFPGFLCWDNGTLVSFHQRSWTGPAAGLPLNGGRIAEVDGVPFEGGRRFLDRIAALAPGTIVSYRVIAAEGSTRFEVPTMSLGWDDYLATFAVYLLNGVTFLLIATIALLLRPELASARSLAWATACMGLLFLLAIDYFSSYRFVPAYLVIEGITPAALWGFVLTFPVERVTPRSARLAATLMALGGLVLGATSYAFYYREPEVSRGLTYVVYVLVGLAGLTMVASFAESLFRAPSVRARSQASVVFAGGLVALVLPSIAVLAFFVLGWTISASWMAILLPLFPLSVLYAIVRHDLLGVERFVRITTGYVLATSAVVVVYAGAVLAIDRFVVEGAGRSPMLAFLLLIGIAVAFEPLRRRMQDLVDRLFYRTRLDVADFLERTSAELASVSEEPRIVELAERRCREALNVAWARFSPEATPGHAAIAEPVRLRDERLGMLACGEKQSGAPFAERERELLRGLAAQLALALQTARALERLRRTQEVLVRTERLAAIGEFAGAVAHGVRNPLSGIRATAQAALEDGESGAASLEAVIRETDRLDQRIQALLDFSRPFEPNLRPVGVHDLLGTVARAIAGRAAREGVEVRLLDDPDGAVVESDPDYLEEAVLELVGNALRFVGRGDRIALSVQRDASGCVSIRVADTGPGIPEAIRDRIFELFFSTRTDGTGLGLATVRKIVGRLGASVVLEDSGPGGTVFRIDLPA